jgi:DNA transformation protein
VSPDDIRELFSAFRPVEVRRLFGGAGIYADGTMFGLVHAGLIHLKAGEHNAAAFDRERLAPFSYKTKDGEHQLTSYRRIPDRLYDDPEELAAWARDALAAAQRSKAGKRHQSPKRAGQGRQKAGKRSKS